MHVTYSVKRLLVITLKMSTAIAYSFMTMDQHRRSEEKNIVPRQSSSNHSDRYSNVAYDNTSESGTLSRQGRRRPRKRSSSSSRTKKGPPRVKVEIVVQFFKVGEIDTLKEQFSADVIVKAKWREPTFDGQQSTPTNDSVDFARLWNPKLYIENSLGDPKEQIRHRIVYNDKGEAFIYEKRVAKGTFMENLELDDFPFDVQDLTITVASELPINECELIEDKEEHHVVNRQSFVDEQEWHLYVHTECNKKELVIDQVDNSVKRSALSVKCRAARRPGYFVWNIFMITFLICSLAFATFSVDKGLPQNRLQLSFTLILTGITFKSVVNSSLPRISYLTYMFLICSLAFATFSVDKGLPQNRLQLSFTLVLTAVAFKSVVNSSLPRISYLTYMDKYLLVSMVMLSAVCTWHAIVTRLIYDRPYADRIENIVLTILSILYILYNIGFIFIIYLFPCKKRRVMSQKDKEYKFPPNTLENNRLAESYSSCQVQEETTSARSRTKRGVNSDVKILISDQRRNSANTVSSMRTSSPESDETVTSPDKSLTPKEEPTKSVASHNESVNQLSEWNRREGLTQVLPPIDGHCRKLNDFQRRRASIPNTRFPVMKLNKALVLPIMSSNVQRENSPFRLEA